MEVVMHLARPRADDPSRSSADRLCDGGPALDLPDAAAAIKAWKSGGWKQGDAAAVTIRWMSCSDATRVTCEACRAHPEFKGYGVRLDKGLA